MGDFARYNCAEQYMMAQKALLFKDIEAHDDIMKTLSPRQQKMRGREIKNFDQKTWDENRLSIVLGANSAKFTQNFDLMLYLLGTGDKPIVEASPEDKIWGIGLSANDPLAQNRETWKGANLLGECLTQVRVLIKSELRGVL